MMMASNNMMDSPPPNTAPRTGPTMDEGELATAVEVEASVVRNVVGGGVVIAIVVVD